MIGTLGDLIAAREHELFVGRARELEQLRALLRSDAAAPQRVLFVCGPGGVGKSSLLREYMRLCDELDIASIYVDARHLVPAPEAVLAALGADDTGQAFEPDALGKVPRRVILFDTFELLRPLRDWFLAQFIPAMPQNTVLVVADREPPPAEWRARGGVSSIMAVLPLRNLDPVESRAYLERRNVDPPQVEQALAFTHGYPLALALAADVTTHNSDVEFNETIMVDLTRRLLERLVRTVPGPQHQRALEAASMVRTLTESLLGEMLDEPDVREIFDWITSLSFISADRFGLYPHDLARDALAYELRWRNPDRFVELHNRARHYYYRHFYTTSGQTQQRILTDLIFLHRDNPVVRPYFDWQTSPEVLASELRSSDTAPLLAVVAKHEGPESAGCARYWFERRPDAVIVFRGVDDTPAGFMLLLPLDTLTGAERESDPAVVRALEHIERTVRLRPGETATLFRFWMSARAYQQVSDIQSLIFINAVRHYLLTPGLAYTMFPCADPEFWAPVFAYADLHRTPVADFTVGGHAYGMYCHDWRRRPPIAWLALLAEREVLDDAIPPPTPAPALVVLSRRDFDDAIRRLLRNLNSPDQLADNPLLRSRMVIDRVGMHAGQDERIAGLQRITRETAEQLTVHLRSQRGYRALYHTFLVPTPTQEKAAEVLDLPFSTYRRHLSQGVKNLTALLWQLELGDTDYSVLHTT